MFKFLKKIKPGRDAWLALATVLMLLVLIWVAVLSLRFLIISITKALEVPSAKPSDVIHFDSEGFKELGL